MSHNCTLGFYYSILQCATLAAAAAPLNNNIICTLHFIIGQILDTDTFISSCKSGSSTWGLFISFTYRPGKYHTGDDELYPEERWRWTRDQRHLSGDTARRRDAKKEEQNHEFRNCFDHILRRETHGCCWGRRFIHKIFSSSLCDPFYRFRDIIAIL